MKSLIIAATILAAATTPILAQTNTEVDQLLSFLYKGMPLPDRIDYSESFYRQNIESSLKARQEMPWGKIVPEREFKHFVLPVRINNESLDLSRPIFYKELKERVKGLSMQEAILEVNHWCHEKVTYQPSDARTSNPLSTVSQAIGRCGEESTFTVAALRAVGIPARQVYTPRWAHTDDNHAWVEAWADGKWYFIGACEPEPILNMAWFNAPASRGMLMNTAAFGVYDGPEEVLSSSPYATVINVTSNYADVASINVHVQYPDGKPATGIPVDFRLYNYAEFFPLATKHTDSSGNAQLTTGRGEVLAWASDGYRFGYAVAMTDSTTTIILDKDDKFTGSDSFTLTPPSQSISLPTPSPEEIAINDKRKSYEDSIRNAYTSTFATVQQAREIANKLGVNAEALAIILPKARGNHSMIVDFLTDAKDRDKAMRLLATLCEKDLRDIPREVLEDALNTPQTSSPLFDKYVMAPRVEYEALTPYKSFFQKEISAKQRKQYAQNPLLWVEAIKQRIVCQEEGNPKQLRMSPMGTWNAKMGDNLALKILFVSGARSCGIPARIDPVTGKAQYATADGIWIDVLEKQAPAAAPTGKLNASEIKLGAIAEPKYYSHFSLCKIVNQKPKQLEYPDGTTLTKFIEDGILETGQYMLVTGQRMANGSVLTNIEFFNIEADKTTNIPFIFPNDKQALQVIGSLNAENIYHNATNNEDRSILSTTGRGYYVLAILKPNHEPSEHALNDISALKKEFEERKESLMLLFSNESDLGRFDASRFPNLPNNAVLGYDKNGSTLAELTESLKLPEGDYPIIVIADTFNRVVHVSHGYTIGTGETLLSLLRQLQ